MDKFLTFTEYINLNIITPNEEDYIEMIFRLKNKKITNSLLANKLNVKPSSITKMIKKLELKSLIIKDVNGEIKLTEYGKKLGESCMKRHDIVERFLINIGVKENILLHTEVMEHSLNQQITEKFKTLNDILEKNSFIKDYLNDI